MRICSVTICPNEEEAAEAEATVGGLVQGNVRVMYGGPIKDFSMARNGALEDAADAEGQYDWALMLDTDERIHCADLSFLDVLQTTDCDMLHVWAADHSYAKPRFFRLPAKGKYVGPTHECWVADFGSKVGTLEGITFSELPKTAEQYKAKAERDQKILEDYVWQHPDDPRWWYYLGDTYSGLGKRHAAEGAFRRCFDCDGWDEESAWSAYRIASIQAEDRLYDQALMWCCRGMARHSGMAELPWLAGFCCFHLGRYQQAIWWEEMAIALNKAKAAEHRINFRHEPALFEGPYDVMAHAHAAMGKDVSASADRILCDLYMGERLKAQKSRAPRT